MTLLTRVKSFFLAVVNRRRIERDMADEWQFHLDSRTDALVTSGMTRAEASRQARREFGDTLRWREQAREALGLRLVQDLVTDVRYALRQMRRSPGLATVAIVTLALGIGANTTVFSIANDYLFAKAPVGHPDELVAFRWVGENNVRQMSSQDAYVAGSEGGRIGSTFPFGVVEQMERDNRTLTNIIAFAPGDETNVVADGNADIASSQFVSGGFYSGLAISALRGRTIAPSDDIPSAEPVVVLSAPYWQRRFGADPAVVGKHLTINGAAFTVIGVSSSSFRDILHRGFPAPPDMTLPLASEPRLRGSGSFVRTPAAWWLTVLGRIRADVSLPQASANMQAALDRTVQAYLGDVAPPRGGIHIPQLTAVSASRGISDPSPSVTHRIQILAIIVGLTLLIVCVNLSNLLLSRSVARQREFAMRAAMGAPTTRIVRQLFTEAVVLAGYAAVVSVVVTFFAESSLSRVILQQSSDRPASLEMPVVVFVVGLTLMTALVFGVAPTWRSTRLLGVSDRTIGASASRGAGRWVLIAQVALSLPLLIAAGLFLRTLVNLRQLDVGFNPKDLVLFTVQPQLSGYDPSRTTSLYADIEDRLTHLPGVRGVTSSAFGSTLLDGGAITMFINMNSASQGKDPRTLAQASMLIVEPNFFSVVQIPLTLGRGFAASDVRESSPVALVSQTFARTFFADTNPIGRRFRAGGTEVEIAGVVGDAKVQSLREPAPATLYRPVAQMSLPTRRFIVRTVGDPRAQIGLIRDRIKEIDAALPLKDVSTQADRIDAKYLTTERTFAITSSLVSALAIVVAMIGVFGLMSYSVAQRTREIGIRVALGAQRRDVMRLMMRDTLVTVGAGILTGLVVAASATHVVVGEVFGVSPYDPTVVLCAVTLLLGTATVAAYVPSRRATRVDPLVALRCE